jgi:hypothetical protein
MKIEIFYVPGCANYKAAKRAVASLLASKSVRAEIASVPVRTEAEAKELRFPGSPTIRVNGNDVEPESAPTIGLACRLYRNHAGVPAQEAIRRAVALASEDK